MLKANPSALQTRLKEAISEALSLNQIKERVKAIRLSSAPFIPLQSSTEKKSEIKQLVTPLSEIHKLAETAFVENPDIYHKIDALLKEVETLL